jgi:hypothetical protein
MTEIKCAHESCRCSISSHSPEPYCCEECERDEVRNAHEQRCDCGHAACDGVPGTVEEEPPTEKLEGAVYIRRGAR